jgi:hypothetical protein
MYVKVFCLLQLASRPENLWAGVTEVGYQLNKTQVEMLVSRDLRFGKLNSK